MAILIGMDEAGYGPQLGPLVVAASAWEVGGEEVRDQKSEVRDQKSEIRSRSRWDDSAIHLCRQELFGAGNH